ncbi:BTAD domain-containing putative transcriptional regulator [Actinoplanes sp. NPDC048791]|uniref:BTAD domain-containing putative transcriptional regulator n=1 Tax=Actinoplanes sp. NPDC048791 TaxID=3154623 RepID=UPI0033DF2B73
MIRLMAAIRTTVAVVTLLVAVPLLLAAVGGSPLPDRVPSSVQIQNWLKDPMQPQHVAATIRAGAWLIWALLVATVLGVMGARVRRWRWARLTVYLPGPVQGLAATLLGAATVTTAVGVPQPHAAIPAAAQDSVPPGPQAMVNAATATATTVTAHRDERRLEQSSSTVTVRRGDTLWGIAADRLGSAQRWKQIYRLNTDRYPRMHGGDHIEPGWTLTLPTRARKPVPEPTSPTTPIPGPTSTSAHPSPAPSAAGERDGVVEPSGPTRTPTSASPGEAAVPQPRANQDRGSQAGVSLASGSWLDIGLATAIAAAVALVWGHRRRRYTSRRLSPDLSLDDPDLAPMPSVITEIRRRLRGRLEPTDTEAGAVVSSTAPAPTTAAHAFRPLDSSSVDRSLGTQEPVDVDDSASPAASDGDEVAEDKPSRMAGALAQGRPVVPALTNPAPVVWPASGLGLTGPGAEPAARGFLTAALADRDPHAAPGRVVLPSTTAATLLGAAAVTLPNTPRLIVTDDLDDALTVLEQEILHRSRLVYGHEVDTVAAMRAADPHEEPTPPILLVADADSSHERTRIAALLAQGHRLDVHGVLLGAWPAGDTVIVDTDGSTTPGDDGRHGRHPADIDRLAVLDPAETAAVITTLAEAHTGQPQTAPLVESPPHQPVEAAAIASPDTAGAIARRVLTALADLGEATAAKIGAHLELPFPTATAHLVQWEHSGHAEIFRTDTGQTRWRLTATGRAVAHTGDATPHAADADTAASASGQPQAPTATNEPAIPAEHRHAEVYTALQWPDPNTTFTSEPPPPPPQNPDAIDKAGRVTVTVLGEAGIVATNPDRSLRKKALELLVYLAVHDGSATTEAILDDLLPDAPASKAPERLYTYVSDLRAVMRRIGGPATYLTHPHRRYALNPDTVNIDLWRMRAAIREVHHAADPQQRIDALHRAVDAYRGPLADGADYEWAEPYREAIRQQALDAHLALADALTDDPAAQVRVLEAAIGHSPYNEQLYQQAMRARAALGHIDAVRTLHRRLGRALAEIDAEATDDTITLANQLIAEVQRPARRTDTHISGT